MTPKTHNNCRLLWKMSWLMLSSFWLRLSFFFCCVFAILLIFFSFTMRIKLQQIKKNTTTTSYSWCVHWHHCMRTLIYLHFNQMFQCNAHDLFFTWKYRINYDQLLLILVHCTQIYKYLYSFLDQNLLVFEKIYINRHTIDGNNKGMEMKMNWNFGFWKKNHIISIWNLWIFFLSLVPEEKERDRERKKGTRDSQQTRINDNF